MPGTIFSRQTMKNRDWKEARSHVQGNHTVRPGHVRASSTPWCARRSSGSSTRCPTLQADEIANAAGYGRSGGRKAYRAGHYERSLTAKAGRPGLKVPKLKGALFESAVIERYRRREESVEEALIDMCLAGVSTRQVNDTGQLLWGDRMPSQTLSGKLRRVYAEIDECVRGRWMTSTHTCSWTACGTSAPGAEAWGTSASWSPSASARLVTARPSASPRA